MSVYRDGCFCSLTEVAISAAGWLFFLQKPDNVIFYKLFEPGSAMFVRGI